MKSAFVFPGQGSQSIGMLSEIATEHDIVKETFQQASDALNYDLWDLVSNGPEESLNQTDRTQPAMLTAGIAMWRVWQSVSAIKPDYFAGHSLGEYTALVAAEAIDFSDAVKLVELRGQYMQQAVPAGEGAMAAILGLSDDIVRDVCSEASIIGVVEAVNFNSPGQVVIAGSTAAVKKATEIATEKGAKRALILPVSVPSHCALMRPAAEQLAQKLDEISIHMPTTPVIHNASVTAAEDVVSVKSLLAQQLYSPVRWVETVQWFAAENVSQLVECGPGKVLAGLTKRIDKSVNAVPLFDLTTLEKAQQVLGE
ncbi:MAG: [acyl-carrier-protein] S-malonyltransferase [Methylophaga sp.]|uniref:ACP S-malonyltransferase n=1 Tax=Methylophaga sp. UBA678 TaxID=1946901 RepID=UPI000C4B6C16|nr:ACP S-malonyltransferase [Methylophaga sp. UBA678]MAX50535.1 [acyl-carrier-protein] S-malonyltransferase [Methylophaga sp.]|tara:strand:+ start:1886 stop:2821 length:936 start_codon:yes stop_codon:yes gene_type:complete